MRLDLHCHSRHSDGVDDVPVVLRKAEGLALFALTDHDTWAGTPDTLGALPGAEVIAGMELSCEHAGRTAHLLVYGGEKRQELAARLEELREGRRLRVYEICARFQRWQIQLDPEAILKAAGGATPGRPHVAQALVRAGICSSTSEAFTRFLRDGGPADVPAPRLPVDEGVALARATGARVALAHPHGLGHPEVVRALCARLRPEGLEGLEAFYGPYAPRVRATWLSLADELGLVATAGSDYHGPGRGPGVDRPGVEINEDRAARLMAWLRT